MVIQKILEIQERITKQLIRKVERVTELEIAIKTLMEHTQHYVPVEDLEALYAVIDMAKKLAEYKTAEEEGRLVVLPYKIGMTLFLPRHGEILPFRVVGTRIYTNRTEIDLIYCGNNKCYEFLSTHPTVQYIEREYFHTKEEAQKALEGKEK